MCTSVTWENWLRPRYGTTLVQFNIEQCREIGIKPNVITEKSTHRKSQLYTESLLLQTSSPCCYYNSNKTNLVIPCPCFRAWPAQQQGHWLRWIHSSDATGEPGAPQPVQNVHRRARARVRHQVIRRYEPTTLCTLSHFTNYVLWRNGHYRLFRETCPNSRKTFFISQMLPKTDSLEHWCL